MGHHGHGPAPLREDKGFQTWYYMRENLGEWFKFTKKTARTNIIFMGIIPLSLGYVAYKTVGVFNLAGSKRTKPVYATEYVPRK